MSKDEFIYSVLKLCSLSLKRKCYDVKKFETIIQWCEDKNALLCFDLMDIHLNSKELNEITLILKKIVWKFVRHLYIQNTKLLALSLDKNQEYDSFVKSESTKIKCGQLHDYLKILYKRHYRYELSDDSVDWNEIKTILLHMCILCK
ncbi:hypothetical protein [Apocheima cinerarium nucleopolyhedrovirus]|uniref:hypothetical protein n=1 Tax=Apocheima cinerarium nucleopolyhedrovirus TaxID=307461 RepID=UPI0001D920A7|nr:hypothetical protein [Apocheima cinerarium nucleopolyhedrovirus]ADB84441.1 hypothetical protein [Apocheima cinerarium nucleopolyhedrovirus]